MIRERASRGWILGDAASFFHHKNRFEKNFLARHFFWREMEHGGVAS